MAVADFMDNANHVTREEPLNHPLVNLVTTVVMEEYAKRLKELNVTRYLHASGYMGLATRDQSRDSFDPTFAVLGIPQHGAGLHLHRHPYNFDNTSAAE